MGRMKMGFVLGAGVGFVLGSRAGRGPYDKIMEKINGAKGEMSGGDSMSDRRDRDQDIVLPGRERTSSTNPNDLVVPGETSPAAEEAGGPGLSAPGGYDQGRVPTPAV